MRPAPSDPNPPDLSACLARAAAGEPAAARELAERMRPIVIRAVRARLGGREPADDLAQEVFLKLFSRLGQYRAAAPFGHWVARIARHACLDHLRARRCRPELRWADLDLRAETLPADEPQERPGDRMDAGELLRLALPRLKAEDRKFVMQFHFENRSLAEIGAGSGRSPAFVKNRLFRSREKMRRTLAELAPSDRAGRRAA